MRSKSNDKYAPLSSAKQIGLHHQQPADMGASRHGHGGHLPPWKCFKVFCALETLSRPIIYALFWRVEVVHLVLLACVLRATTKKGRQLF